MDEYLRSHAGRALIKDIAKSLSRSWSGVRLRARVLDISSLALYRCPRHPNEYRKFPCGCEGVLPDPGVSNKFVSCHIEKGQSVWICRVTGILLHSARSAKISGYKPVDRDIPHSVIRRLMDEPNCERCGLPLRWEFGPAKTPHLHHNHETGEVCGFTHPKCNLRALEDEIDRLRAENQKLKRNQE